jgi:hypothetical protein
MEFCNNNATTPQQQWMLLRYYLILLCGLTLFPLDLCLQKFQRCVEMGEAFSASFLISKKLLVALDTKVNLTTANCAKGAFIAMRPNGQGAVMQTIDLLDLSVVHLSAYERYPSAVKSELLDDNVPQVMRKVMNRVKKEKQNHVLGNSTIAFIPYFGKAIGSTSSKAANRQTYLHITYWSIKRMINDIIVYVCNEEDYHYVRCDDILLQFYTYKTIYTHSNSLC